MSLRQMPLENFYECADFFLARTSLASLETLNNYYHHTPDELFDFVITNSVFLEAIGIASPSLSQSIHRFIQSPDKNIAELRKITNGVLKYLVRMASRATPFGLFSFVWWGQFSEKTQLTFKQADIRKCIKPDMGWTHSLINLFIKDHSFIRNLKVMISPWVHEECGKYYLKKLNALTKKEELSSINQTEFTKSLFTIAHKPITYSDLENELLSLFSKFEPKKITTCLWDIFQKGYLISELNPKLDKFLDIEEFLHSLNRYKDHLTTSECQTALDSLSSLCELFREYQDSPVGNGSIQLANLEKAAKKIVEAENVIQLDAFKDNGNAFLSQELKPILEEISSILFQFSNKQDHLDHISDYYEEFAEKYGLQRLVPLTELINPNLGLGIPKPQLTNRLNKNGRAHTILSKLLSGNLSEIIIDDMVNKLPVPSKEEIDKAPFSLELFFEIVAPSQEQLDEGDYKILLNPLAASAQAGSTFGRFLYLWDKSKTTQLTDLLKREESLLSETLSVEASFQPLKAKTTNVCFHEKTREFQLNFCYRELSEKTIEVNDIYVGASEKGLYLYSKKLQKEIRVILSTAVNAELAPPPLKLMLDISCKNFSQFSCFIFDEFKDHIFLPRVRYKNVILSPARWYFTFQNLKLDENAKIEEVDRVIREAIQAFAVSEEFFLVEFDNRLLLKQSNCHEFKWLLDHFMSKKELILFESIKSDNYLPVVRSEDGRHISEFVVPLVKKRQDSPRKAIPIHPLESTIPFEKRKKIVGSSHWLYAKLYLSTEFEEEFIFSSLYPFTSHLMNNSIIDKWFFIRYREGKPHIRLRLSGKPEVLNTQGLYAFSSWMGNLIENQIISEFSLHNYNREVERYGGPDLIDLAEEMFCFDSKFCAYALKTLEMGNVDFKPEFIAAFNILFLLKIFYSSHHQILQFLSAIKDEMGLLKGNRKELKNFNAIMSLIWSDSDYQDRLDHFSSIKDIINSLDFLSQEFDRFKARLDECFNDNRLWNQREQIVDSFIHMHCNRMLGPNLDLEKKARVIAYSHIATKMRL